MDTNKNYTPNQVTALLEDMRGEFRFVAEAVSGMSGRMEHVETRLASVEFELRTVKDVLRIELPSMNRRLTAVEAKIS